MSSNAHKNEVAPEATLLEAVQPSFAVAWSNADWFKTVEHYSEEGETLPVMVDFVGLQHFLISEYDSTPIYNFSKRLFDQAICLLAVIILSPLFLAVALAIKLTSRGPIFYTQYRLGQFGKPFRIYKFRTMNANATRAVYCVNNEMQGMFKIKADPRLTPIGKLLRRWSIDELPQLWNVAKADMSLVGPRPLALEDNCIVPEESRLRFAVRPGITGYWQATARDLMDGKVKIHMDAEYVARRGWRFDLWLLLRTVPMVIRGIGAW